MRSTFGRVILVVALMPIGWPTLTRGEPDSADKVPRGPEARVMVELDASQAPESEEWLKKAKELILEWYPKVSHLLASEGYTPPAKIKLVLRSDMGLKIPGMAQGSTIFISSAWIQKHPEDLGMVIHEMTHVIQSYHRSPAMQGWLTEGLADYIRFFHYEPGPAIGKFHPEKANYTDGYRTSARFLAWIEKKHDAGIIQTLNTACRQGKYTPEIFKKATSRSVEELWQEFVADAERVKEGAKKEPVER